MDPWVSDAKNYTIINIEDLVLTNDIKKFLLIDKSTKYFIVAPKGVGKTLFLRCKRNLFTTSHKKRDDVMKKTDVLFLPHDNEPCFIPKTQELIRAPNDIILEDEKADALKGMSLWSNIWKTSLSLSIIKNVLDKTDYEYRNDLRTVYNSTMKKVPDEIRDNFDIKGIYNPVGNLIELLKLNIKQILSLHLYQNYFNATLDVIQSSVIAFIDDVDSDFIRYLNNFYQQDIWYDAQMGLVKAINEINGSNTHINIFASIRMEAYLKLMFSQESKAHQISSESLEISYTPVNLKEIFENNIRYMDESDLLYPEYKRKNPIYAFLGLNNNRLNNGEHIFCYILRHTLKRPRDLMTIGAALGGLSLKERDEISIKKTINNKSDFIANTFLNEMKPFTQILNFDNIFKLIPSNILTHDDAKEICSKYNSRKTCVGENCRLCKNRHVFCDLYKIGLLGIITQSRDDGYKEEQIFLGLGEGNWTSNFLPESRYYLIHPLLNHKLYKRIKGIIIGDGYTWDESLLDESLSDQPNRFLSWLKDQNCRIE